MAEKMEKRKDWSKRKSILSSQLAKFKDMVGFRRARALLIYGVPDPYINRQGGSIQLDFP